MGAVDVSVDTFSAVSQGVDSLLQIACDRSAFPSLRVIFYLQFVLPACLFLGVFSGEAL